MSCFKRKIFSLISLFVFSTGGFAASPGDPNHIDFALISDPHVDINNYRAVNINPSSGDKGRDLDKPSFVTLTSKMGNELEELPENPSFVVVLGDIPSHNAGKRRSQALTTVFQTFYDQFNPMPMFYTFGNNDSLTGDYGPFKSRGNSAYEIDKSVNEKDGFLSSGELCPFAGQPCLSNENKDYGYYSAYIGDHLKLLSLNSVLYSSKPGFTPSHEGDQQQLQWLSNELKDSQAKNEQVILTMHIAPNIWLPEYKTQFQNMLKSYPNVIVGIFVGHSHRDEFRAIKTKQQIIPIIFAAGFSPTSGNSASFKTVSLGRSSESSPWSVDNYSTYYFKGDKANNSVVTKYYDFDSAFCPSNNGFLTSCLKMQMKGRGSRYTFSPQASQLFSQHINANPAVPGQANAKYWVLNY
ncbi:Calcineurin-like phosphoesterase [Legionella massiliensis]|uniref:Calcineurin-like phosphoesterase n=1 Tax=Legionella massiliensis TaxID=1034943 RepID=A0A078KXL9_9GAMM|nr:metallophosphoesterase [Legionella massiliensis]CDZ76499.1 Calcineurin-like phosphoesterase [Legionella massiliensis]CEE12237.1 Calcineurin-like phosphoesterase [Legionella massiliensis]